MQTQQLMHARDQYGNVMI